MVTTENKNGKKVNKIICDLGKVTKSPHNIEWYICSAYLKNANHMFLYFFSNMSNSHTFKMSLKRSPQSFKATILDVQLYLKILGNNTVYIPNHKYKNCYLHLHIKCIIIKIS